MPYTGGVRGSRFNREGRNIFQGTLLLLSVIAFLVVTGVHLIAGIQFKRNYAGHLKRASDANSLKLAEKELLVAVAYLDSYNYNTPNGRSMGRLEDHTSIVYTTPAEQISFHYDNVKASLDEVQLVIAKGEAATPLEKSNILMKLRETLLDDGDTGHHVTYPQGLDVYPNNTPLAFIFVLSLIVGAGAFVCWDRR